MVVVKRCVLIIYTPDGQTGQPSSAHKTPTRQYAPNKIGKNRTRPRLRLDRYSIVQCLTKVGKGHEVWSYMKIHIQFTRMS